MHPYVLSLAAATLISTACGGAVALQQRGHRGSQLAGLLLIGCGFWSLSQTLAHLSPTAAWADLWFRLGTFGLMFVGPMALHVFMEASGEERLWVRRARAGLYATGGTLLVLVHTTDWVAIGAAPTAWGYRPLPGPLFGLTYLHACAGVTLGGVVGSRVMQRFSEAERRQLPWIGLAVFMPVSVSAVTDTLLPMLGISFPPLGSIALAFLALVIVWIVVHFGYSMLTPGSFAADILSLLPDGVAMLRPDERIRSANEGLARMAGRPAAELENTPIGDLLSWSFESEEFDEVDCELQSASGGRIPVSVSATALRDRQGNALGRVLVVRDLREVADLRRRLVTSARLAAVGELAAGIAHEINNPLAFVRSNLSQLEKAWKAVREKLEVATDAETAFSEAVTDLDELIADSVEGVDRAAEIIRGVKSFAHAGSEKREYADLNQLLEDVLRVAAAQLRNRVEVERDFGDVPRVPCTPQQLRQVFMNLVLNASQAIETSGTIRLATRPIDGGVRILVEDDGPGIAPDVIDRIFDPFFTTKPVGVGTGLGLGIAYQIVKQHRGSIAVESTPGSGTVFRVDLPGE